MFVFLSIYEGNRGEKWLYNQEVLKPTKAAVLRCYVCGYRGDWKALSQVFAFERFYNKNEATVLGERAPPKNTTFI